MLAGVDYVLMGAGIPMKIPGVLDRFVTHEPATYPLTVSGASADDAVQLSFDPREFVGSALPPLTRPKFLAIIASDVLALSLTKRANGTVDGFIVEGADGRRPQRAAARGPSAERTRRAGLRPT